MEDALISSWKKVLDRAAAPEKDDGLLKGLKTELHELETRLAKLEGTSEPPSTTWLPANCERDLRSSDCALIQLALYRRVGRPVDGRNQAWIDGIGGPATFGAVRMFLESVGAPRVDYLSSVQLRQLIYNSASPATFSGADGVRVTR
jgi:hypothetical protein